MTTTYTPPPDADPEWEPPTPAEALEHHNNNPKTLHEGNPFAHINPEQQADTLRAIKQRHLLGELRAAAGLTLAVVAANRGVTPDAARQTEHRDITNLKLSSLIDQIRAIGYDVDAEWVIEALADRLPERTLHTTAGPSQ